VQLQLPRPSLTFTVPADLAPDEARWPWHAAVPGSRKVRPDGSWTQSIKMIGWVRGKAIEPSAWERRQAEKLAVMKANRPR
jgi:hypothetical protein